VIRLGFSRLAGGVGSPIEGPGTFLRAPRDGDWGDWAALRATSRAFLVPWEPTWPADSLSRAAFRRRIRVIGAEWREDSGYTYFIFRRSGPALVGGVTLSNMRRGVAQTASLGYWVGAPFARQGLMTEALSVLLPYAFERLGLHRIEAACLPQNAASRGLLAKVGFIEEGYARGYLRINGEWRDHVLYGLLQAELRLPNASPRPVPARASRGFR
jgi:[ribosomal protein S5]-alanine N-acetyltransferase